MTVMANKVSRYISTYCQYVYISGSLVSWYSS